MIASLTSLQDGTVAAIGFVLFSVLVLLDGLVLRPGDNPRRDILSVTVTIGAGFLTVCLALAFYRSETLAVLVRFAAWFFTNGVDVGVAALWVLYGGLVSLWRILGARTWRTFFHRIVLGAQRVAAMGVIAVILVALWRGGFGFWGAPIFAGVAVLAYWTLRTGEAAIDRRDRLVTVVRRYA